MTKDEAAKLIDETFKLAEESFSAGYEQARKDFRTIEDQLTANSAPIVRCKDCRFRGRELECTQFDAYTSAAGDLFSPPDWFYCGYGKRKEE